ncbi:hypothetical protein RRG08_045948 [Elysia crispata]|uniref:Uncharacterized protein n=1 Tax=Elysia crispata TaxID=231223 RepID=A0AAE1E3P9_9GAST|nr:hypothetical protein RRG08_045948 [Elysia crispata]
MIARTAILVKSEYPRRCIRISPGINRQSHTRESEKCYKSAAVASDCAQCSTVGKHILLEDGNAVDAAIASLLCLGLTDPQSMGLGGGFLMTLFNASTGKSTVIDARETAPAKVADDLFGKNQKMSSRGPLDIGVPGEIKGYWYAHQKYGRLPWAKLFEPAIKMARYGFPVPFGLHRAIEDGEELLCTEPSLKEIFFNKETEKLFRQNEIMHRPQLGETLEIIASEGMENFATGTLMKNMMADLEDIGAIVSKQDLLDYQVLEKKPIETTLDGSLRVLCPPPPSCGVVLSFILNILDGFLLNPNDLASPEARIHMYHRTIEAFKFAYAKRSSLGDEDFVDVKELVANLTSKTYADRMRQLITDNTTHEFPYYSPSFYSPQTSGTSHLSVLDQDGNAVSATSSINWRFGCGLRGRRTGIIWNDHLNDFTAPYTVNKFGLQPNGANFIQPGKRPLSDMSPAIVVGPGNNGSPQVRLVIGAAGATVITCALAWVIAQNISLGKNIKEAIDSYRFYHQLLPPSVTCEEGFDEAVIRGLKLKGHVTSILKRTLSVIQAIDVRDGWIFAESDFRKGGSPDGF